MNVFDLWDFGDASASEVRFREAAERATTPLDRAMALTQVARALGLQGRFDEARYVLAEVEPGLSPHGVDRAQYLIELGRVENSSGNRAAAMPHFAASLELAKAGDAEYLIADAAHMLAIAAPLEEQPKYAEQALRLAEASSDDRARRWVGPILNNLGWSYMELGKPEQALRWFEESLEFRLSQGLETPIRLARFALGACLRKCGRPEEALKVLEQGHLMGGSVGFIEEEMAECYLSLGQAEKASRYFGLAHELLTANTDLAQTEPERLTRIKANA